MQTLLLHNDPLVGNLWITSVVTDFTLLPGETVDELVHSIALIVVPQDYPDGKGGFMQRPYAVTTLDKMPHGPGGSDEGGYFLDAYTWDGKTVSISLPKARAVHMTNMVGRQHEIINGSPNRKPLAMLIAAAVLSGDNATAATLRAKLARVQTIDQTLPAQIAAITDLATLKAFIPADLA